MSTSSATPFNWPPLESNPEVFSAYMSAMGLPSSWVFGEVYGFDDDLLAFIPRPVLAVIVNIERLNRAEDVLKGDPSLLKDVPYYMKQNGKLDNACGVIACLHAIFNCQDVISLEEGKTLSTYLHTALNQSPEERASTLENSTDFQEVHKTFASQGQTTQASEQSDVKHHFVVFVVDKKGRLLELDGTKKGPLVVNEKCEDVLKGSVMEIQRRLAKQEISERLSMITLNAKGGE